MMTRGAEKPELTTSQVADVHKALFSITRAADAGYECHSNAKGDICLTRTTGRKCRSHGKGNLYVMNSWVKEDSGSNSLLKQRLMFYS